MYFLLTFVLYILIITVNLTLILTVIMEKSLHEPMYIFLSNLCVNSLFGTIGFYPKFLLDLLSDTHTVTYSWCLLQVYVIYSSVLCEISNITVMSYDRYVAICRPLQYHSILTPHAVLKLLVVAWACPLLASLTALVLTLRIPICGSHIRKLFCDNTLILKLACFQTKANQVWGMILIAGVLLQFVLILISYVFIVRACISSNEGRTKFTKTCLPHILVLAIFIITAVSDVLYGWEGSENLSVSERNALAIQFLIFPPLLNPIIYGLQLPQIRKVVCKQRCKHKILCKLKR
ncbi:olfactory receptor 6N1-like [Alosa pseudoharengus]|uniref:olfactory receptor 6N1-like n=1 Tax=Alosa pseudoharengus TaxID=34774 RepID=UPI003F8C6CE8